MATETWAIDTVHSSIGFWVRHLMISKVHGRFTKWTANLYLDLENLPASKVDVTIDAASIDTNDPGRDGHLRSPDFFDTAKYPNLTFTSTRVEKSGDGLRITGDLDLHGVKREVVLDAELVGRAKDPMGVERVGFAAKATVHRKDFGVIFNMALDAGGVAIGEKVEVSLEIQAKKVA